MDRRVFLCKTTLSAACLLLSPRKAFSIGENSNGKAFPATSFPHGTLDQLAGKGLKELLEFHEKDLMEGYIPFFENKRIDWKYGGYLHEFNLDGSSRIHDKLMYYEARGLWIHAYLVNHFPVSDRLKGSLIKCRDFLVKNALDKNGYWASRVSLDKGEPLAPSTNIYGDIYMILALTETYLATKKESDIDLAIQTAYKVTERVVSPAYQHLAGHDSANRPGTKRLGSWLHFLYTLTSLLRIRMEEGVERIARMCVHNILNYHWQPDSRAYLEVLDHQFKPFPPDPVRNQRVVHGWHSIQAAFVSMDESLRFGHGQMFRDAMETGVSSLENLWVDGRGVAILSSPGMKPSSDEPLNPWGILDDVLVFCLLALEHNHDTLAFKYYNKAFDLGYSYPERWRKPRPEHGHQRGLFHHPRRLFCSIEILKRIIDRGGKPSNFLETASY